VKDALECEFAQVTRPTARPTEEQHHINPRCRRRSKQNSPPGKEASVKNHRIAWIASITLAFCHVGAAGAQGSSAQPSQSDVQQTTPRQPWMNPSLDPDTRADLMIHEMKLDEKIQLIHGVGWGVLRAGAPVPLANNGGAGFVPGIPRLHLPDINLADSAMGVRMAALQGRYATLLPSVLGMSASWDPEAAFLFGSVIGRELRAQGYNMSIGGGMDLIREPRNGRNFEYSSEDPVLAGTMAGQLVRGIQSNHIMEDIKHYVLNDQETGRNFLNAVLDRRALRETDLLAFQIAITSAHPDGVMCSYNRVNGDYACPTTFSFSPMSTALTLEVPISIPRNTQHTPHSKLTSMANWSTFQSK
jgi:hypothetical protein